MFMLTAVDPVGIGTTVAEAFKAILALVVEFFTSVMSAGQTMINFVMSNAICIIPVVMFIVVAIFGMVKGLYKG